MNNEPLQIPHYDPADDLKRAIDAALNNEIAVFIECRKRLIKHDNHELCAWYCGEGCTAEIW